VYAVLVRTDAARNAVEEAGIQSSTSSDISQEQNSSVYADALLKLSPLPRAVVVPGTRQRKATLSEVITSSP